MNKILGRIRTYGIIGFFSYCLHWCYEKFKERQLGIKTAGFIRTEDLLITDADCSDYEPTSYARLFKFFKSLNISPNNDTFIDYGSGKGRAVIVSALFPFKKVIGIEISDELNKIAINNFQQAKNKNILKCQEAEFITKNAFDYVPDNDVTTVFMNNPFSDALLKDALDKLCISVEQNPRPLYILYQYPDWKSDAIEADERFELVKTIKSGFSYAGETSKIYRKK